MLYSIVFYDTTPSKRKTFLDPIVRWEDYLNGNYQSIEYFYLYQKHFFRTSNYRYFIFLRRPHSFGWLSKISTVSNAFTSIIRQCSYCLYTDGDKCFNYCTLVGREHASLPRGRRRCRLDPNLSVARVVISLEKFLSGGKIRRSRRDRHPSTVLEANRVSR